MTCSKCGYNPNKLTEYMKTVIPISKIEARIRYHWEVYRECDDKLAIPVMAVIVELKNLLPKNKEEKNDS